MKTWIFKENSLDLLRLIAAVQVMVLHSFEFMIFEKTNNLFFDLLRLFPGVPIFFFISGYLISKSYERTTTSRDYFKNRSLRIFPALWVCVFVNILLVASTGYLEEKNVGVIDLGILYLAKTTILQFYNPEFMRDFGDGVLNGSLWTICVELQFYLITPMLYWLLKKVKLSSNLILAILLVLFIALNRALYIFAPDYSNTIIWKLYKVSFAPWFYMFLFGVIVQKNFTFFATLLSKVHLSVLLLPYIVITYYYLNEGVRFGNGISPLIYFPLALCAFRFAYSFAKPTKRLLKGNDFSYGIYIWHMPIVNQMIYLTSGKVETYQVLLTFACSIILAVLSWFILEKKVLKMKYTSIKRQAN